MSDEENQKSKGVVVDTHHQPPPPPPPPQNGTFQGVANYPPPQQSQPPTGFPPPGISAPPPQYYAHSYQTFESYQTVEGYAVAEGRPARELDLPCCGIGIGWFLFIMGFFLGAIPWYAGFLLLICGRRRDNREKPGLIACTVAGTLFTIAIVIGVIRGTVVL